MADDRMKNDFQRNMGGKQGEDIGQQSPGRTGQSGQQSGQHTGGQQSGGQFDSQKGRRNLEDDEDFGAGSAGQPGGQNRGGQNR